MRKIKWRNVALLILFIISTCIVLHDLYVIVLKPFFTTIVEGWTWYGLGTFTIALIISCSILDYFIDEFKK